MPTKVTFGIQGIAAEEKIGNYGFFSGTFTAVLQFIQKKGLRNENIVGSIGHDGTNFYLFYWK